MNNQTTIFHKRRLLVALTFLAAILIGGISTRADAVTRSYSYDSLHRLTEVNTGNGCVIKYTYDAAGNRLTYSATSVLLPVIATEPLGCSVFVGGSATLFVAASGTGTLGYQWECNGCPVAGATATSLALNGINAAHAGKYSVVVSDSNGTVTSQKALLTVLQTSFAGWQPAYFTTAEIADAITSGADADPNHDGVSNWMSFAFGINPRGPSQTAALPTLALVSQSGSQYITLAYRQLVGVTGIPYVVCVSDDLLTWDETEAQIERVGNPVATGDGLTETVTARVKTPINSGTISRKFMRLKVVAPQTPAAPTISRDPVSGTILQGSTATLTATALGNSLAYQWECGTPGGIFQPISGANRSSYTTPPLHSKTAFRVVITNVFGWAVSEATTVWPTTLLAISDPPVNQVVNQGQSATFSIAISGEPIGYQWIKGGAPIAGATMSSLTLSNVQPSDEGEYTVTITGGLNTITSSPASLTVCIVPNWLSAFGLDSEGQLGDGTTTSRTTPVAVDMSGELLGKTVSMLTAGYSHSLALTWDGRVFTWGSNNYGQLGDGTTTQRTNPVAVNMSGALLDKEITMIAAGSSNSVALTSDGKVFAWGANTVGQLGDGTTIQRAAPAAVDMNGALSGKAVSMIATGSGHSLALTSDGRLFAWGSNDYGQLGNDTTTFSTTPVEVNMRGVLLGKTVTKITAGTSHSLALTSDGKVFAWGYNFLGQLGDGTTTYRTAPVAVDMSGVLSGKTVSSIAAGSSHSLALTSDGKVFGWGYNITGQLGDGTTAQRTTPVAVNMSGVLFGKTVDMIAAGERHSLALTSDGRVFSWGGNDGQLGDGTTTQRTAPVAVNMSGILSGKTVLAISAGCYHSLLIVNP